MHELCVTEAIYYAYLLRSNKGDKFYVGYTSDLKQRVELHNEGQVEPTRSRRPLEFVYCEASLHQEDALHRERDIYLKTTYGNRYIRSRLRHYLERD